MARVFAGLGLAHLILLFGSAGLGLSATSTGTERHVLLATLTIVLSCFIQVVVFTYLTVSGKFMGQAIHLSSLDFDYVAKAKRLKKHVARCLAAVFLVNLVVAATGAAQWSRGAATVLHLLAGTAALIVHSVAYYRELGVILSNRNLMNTILALHERHRSVTK